DQKLGRPGTTQGAPQGRPGTPGGKPGPGNGPGGGGTGRGGDGVGGTAARIQQRQRSLRWTIHFNYREPGQYVDQLHKLGAIIAIPVGGGRYQVIRNLAERPAHPREEDVSKIERIFWYADNPMPLLQALGVPLRPRALVVFLPRDFEDKLAEAEHAY